MSRAIEDYVCASEDRPHYNNETWDLYGFYYPMRTPHVINIINKTVEKVSTEELNELIDARIPHITETVVNEVLPSISEIDGGDAFNAVKEEEGDD